MAKRPRLTHLSRRGGARMVDVGGKPATRRRAVAEAFVAVGRAIAVRLRREGGLAKGNVFEAARVAGILAAKRTAALIPLCHPLSLDHVDVAIEVIGPRVRVVAEVAAEARTGVEMEALTAASVAALTVYDMVKSAGKGIEIGPVRLLEKEGGKSGRWTRKGGRDAAR